MKSTATCRGYSLYTLTSTKRIRLSWKTLQEVKIQCELLSENHYNTSFSKDLFHYLIYPEEGLFSSWKKIKDKNVKRAAELGLLTKDEISVVINNLNFPTYILNTYIRRICFAFNHSNCCMNFTILHVVARCSFCYLQFYKHLKWLNYYFSLVVFIKWMYIRKSIENRQTYIHINFNYKVECVWLHSIYGIDKTKSER